MELKTKNFTSCNEVYKSIDEENRTITHIISSINPDKSGDVVEIQSIQNETYKNNSVVLWNHFRHIPAIGRSLFQKVEGNYYIAKTEFSKSSELSKELFQLCLEKILNNWSIGALITENPIYKDGYYIYKNLVLNEYSLCNIAANSDCINLSFIKNLQSEILVEDFMSQYVLKNLSEEIIQAKQEYEILRTELNDYKSAMESFKEFQKKYSNSLDDVIDEFRMNKTKKENSKLKSNLELKIKDAFKQYK